ncbi:uncharacterized protein METZ01_LOCUS489264 [marine metagenome]|uniref:Uncharacterized protein n=1 Tax=marine metagenome TaxID=408172 RepID=A0A383CWJ8_9ZZZZ
MSKIRELLIFSLFLLFFACEETPQQAGYSFKIEATALTIEPSLSQKSTQSTPTYEEWGNTVYENGEGYYVNDSAEAGEYTFTIYAKYMQTYSDSVAVDTSIIKTINMGEGNSYTIIGYATYGDYNWSVSEY